MLQKITLENFRCFDRHQVDFKNLSIAVGANNAGKSTLIEAIRIVSLAANRYRGLQYKRPPGWTNLPLREYGVSPALRMIDLRGGSIFHRYGEPPAKIIAEFAEGQKIKVLLNEDAVFAVLFDQDGSCITSKSHAKKKNFPAIKILPQIGPLVEEEKKLSDSHIHANLDSSIASRHFRNQLRLYPDQFAEFKQNARASWKGLDIKELVKEGDSPNEVLSLFVRDGNFSAEIGWMGHGIQMWLQTIWFLARCTTSDIVVLDEPDVYMHADLQRKLIRLLRGKNHQTIVATHSVEIMSEVDAEEILVVDKLKGRSRVATSVPAVQRVIENLGGVQNIHLARLWGSRKCIHVEGKDIDLGSVPLVVKS